MTVQRQRPRVHPYRRRDDMPWTHGDQREFEHAFTAQLGELDRKVDRLTWLVAVGSGVVATAAFALGLIATLIPH